jgi:hypothetical protein
VYMRVRLPSVHRLCTDPRADTELNVAAKCNTPPVGLLPRYIVAARHRMAPVNVLLDPGPRFRPTHCGQRPPHTFGVFRA